MILKKYTNELLKVIIEEGQDVNNFELSRHPHKTLGQYAEIHYKGSTMSFWVLPNGESFDAFKIIQTQFLPGYPTIEHPYPYSLSELKDVFKGWLNFHLASFIENENETDYWKIIRENPLSIEGIDFTKNEPFKKEEQEQLKIGLEEIKVLLSQNFNLTELQIQSTNKRIDYLIGATKRLNKTDWKGIAITTIIAIAYDFSFDEHKRAMLFGLFSKLWAIIQQLPLRTL